MYLHGGKFYSALGMPVVLLLLFFTLSGCASEEGNPLTSSVSDDEATDAFYQCMLDEGVPVERSNDGVGISWNVEDDSVAKIYEEAEKRCDKLLVEKGFQDSPLTDEEKRAEYPLWVGLYECYSRNGVIQKELPSEDVYVQNYDMMGLPYEPQNEYDFNLVESKCEKEAAAYADFSR